MKKIILLKLLILLSINTIYAQQYQKVVLTPNKFVVLAFPCAIQSTSIGFDPVNFVIKENNNLLQLQPLIPFSDETNLMVQTTDNSIYIINLTCVPQIDKMFYNINHEHAENYVAYTDITNSLPTTQEGTPQSVDNTSTTDSDPIFKKVEAEKGYLTMGNGNRVKNFEVYLKGIYTNGDYMYFQILVSNNSSVKYTFDYVGFSKVVKGTKKGVSKDRTELEVTDSYIPRRTLIKQQTIIVCKLPKFTISPEKQILIEMFEGEGGERNISFPIDYDIILTAKSI